MNVRRIVVLIGLFTATAAAGIALWRLSTARAA